MKKALFLAAMLCGLSFASNAAASKAKEAAAEKKPEARIEMKTTRVLLYEMTFTCPKQGWSIPVVGNTLGEMGEAYMFYQTHLDC